jgi:formylglycine-generating enzyme required for sulfatase activity
MLAIATVSYGQQQQNVIIQNSVEPVVIEKHVYIERYRTAYVKKPQPARTPRKLTAPVLLLGHLWVHTEDLGNFKQQPHDIVSATNRQVPFDRDDWRIPTPSELAVMENNADKIGIGDDMYMATDARNGVLRLVSTGKTASEKAREAREVEARAAAERVTAVFVRVEGGTFQMGNNSGDSDERPAHTVTVSSFSMSNYPVTQWEWFKVMGTNPTDGEGDNYPVYNVSWHDAMEYCNRRNQKEGLTPANGYRLPTEAEWEYAARGGNKGDMSYEYSGSNNVGAVAWYSDNSGGRIHPVGAKLPNALGLYDMSGNIWEWCSDWYGAYPSEPQHDPAGASSGSNRVRRGGGWDQPAQHARSTRRYRYSPTYRNNHLGFRLVRP